MRKKTLPASQHHCSCCPVSRILQPHLFLLVNSLTRRGAWRATCGCLNISLWYSGRLGMLRVVGGGAGRELCVGVALLGGRWWRGFAVSSEAHGVDAGCSSQSVHTRCRWASGAPLPALSIPTLKCSGGSATDIGLNHNIRASWTPRVVAWGIAPMVEGTR